MVEILTSIVNAVPWWVRLLLAVVFIALGVIVFVPAACAAVPSLLERVASS